MSLKRSSYSKSQHFSLVELLIVITLILILSSILFPVLRTALSSASIISCKGNLQNVGLALSLFSDDTNGYIPTSQENSPFSTSKFVFMAAISEGVGSTIPTGLGTLLYNQYLDHGRSLHCPAEEEGVYYDRKKDYQLPYKSPDGLKNQIDAAGNPAWFTSYVYRGHLMSNNHTPAHGPALARFDPYLSHISKRPCTPGSCGEIHNNLAIISDDFTYYSQVNGYFEPQGRFHHKTAYNVFYTDGHAETIQDPNETINNYKNMSPFIYNITINSISEDIWDAFDGDIGNNAGYSPPGTLYNLIYGLK